MLRVNELINCVAALDAPLATTTQALFVRETRYIVCMLNARANVVVVCVFAVYDRLTD